jgi:citrate lyase subunit beta/citryl-CoA lyase
MALLRSYLFAPGHDEKLLDKVFAAGADAVVLDLEDAVPPAEKDRARRLVAQAVASRPPGGRPRVFVRINAVDGDEWPEDVCAVVQPGVCGLRLPKAKSREQVVRVHHALREAEAARGLADGAIELACTVESARGLAAARELAGSPRVRNLAFGATDLAADLGLLPGPEEMETLPARAELVLASRLAGLDPPIASVHTRLHDDDGLRRTTEAARRLGFFGRSVIHPRQLAVVHEVFTPAREEVAWAEAVLRAHEEAARAGSGASVAEGGQFVDAAVVRRARAVLALAPAVVPEARRG